MQETRTDRRRLSFETDLGAEESFRRGHAGINAAEVRTARALLRIEQTRTYLQTGCASAIDFAVRDGMDRTKAVALLDLGRTLDAAPQAADDLRNKRLTPQAASDVGRVFRPGKPSAGPPGDDAAGGSLEQPPPPDPAEWLDRAKTMPRKDLRREVRAQIEGEAQRDRVVGVSFHVKDSVREDFRRARTLASRRAGTPLSDGQAFAHVTRDYLDRHDPLRKARQRRRVGPTSERPDDRYVPAAVRAAVLERSGDRCECPVSNRETCGNRIFLEDAHRRGHAADGDRESTNLFRFCTTHHTLLDAGAIRITSAPGESLECSWSRRARSWAGLPDLTMRAPSTPRARHGRHQATSGKTRRRTPPGAPTATSTHSRRPLETYLRERIPRTNFDGSK